MLIDRAGIAALIPHGGAMRLLESVLSWDADRVSCIATSHVLLDNPMRHGGRLGILCGVEYAAQAMALHGALASSETGATRVGYLASLRALTWEGDRLDLLTGPLTIDAERLHGEDGRLIYGFSVRHDDRTVLCGRAAVALGAAA